MKQLTELKDEKLEAEREKRQVFRLGFGCQGEGDGEG